MKKYIIILALIFPISVQAAWNPKWIGCNENSECRTYRASCGWASANANYLDAAREHEKKESMARDCMAGQPNFAGKPPKSECINHNCVITND